MEPIKVFISWSGSRSKALGETLRKWLPRMNQLIRPWMSAQDIGAGSLWFQETLSELESAKFGIICLTSDNLSETWIHFEAGALLDVVGKQHICPYLLDIDTSSIKGPLSQFQAKTAAKENTREILLAISSIDNDLNKELINDSFERIWPDFEKDLASINDKVSMTKVPARESSDMLQELLGLVRELSRANFERALNIDQKERAEIIIKILKEGIYGTPGDNQSPLFDSIASACVSSFGQLHIRETRERLENELLNIALKRL